LGQVGTDIKSVGTSGDGGNFCPCAGLYNIPTSITCLVDLLSRSIN